MATDILVDPLGLVTIVLAIVGGFIGIFTVIWRVSKNYNDQRNDITQLRKEIAELKTLHVGDYKDTNGMFDKMRIERREEITKALLNQHDKFEVQQKQIDSIRVDVKDVISKINIVDTKVGVHTEDIAKVNERIDKNLGFMTDWIQRVEDRITKVYDVIEGAKKELMGMMNMLINLAGNRNAGSRIDGTR